MVSLLTFFWIWFDLRAQHEDFAPKLAAHSTGVFWFVIPSLPMFLLIPWMLKREVGFWPSIAAGCLLTMFLYFLMARALAKFGIAM